MSQRMPDYEDLRARQARAQESIVTYEPADDPEGRALVQAIHDRKAKE